MMNTANISYPTITAKSLFNNPKEATFAKKMETAFTLSHLLSQPPSNKRNAMTTYCSSFPCKSRITNSHAFCLDKIKRNGERLQIHKYYSLCREQHRGRMSQQQPKTTTTTITTSISIECSRFDARQEIGAQSWFARPNEMIPTRNICKGELRSHPNNTVHVLDSSRNSVACNNAGVHMSKYQEHQLCQSLDTISISPVAASDKARNKIQNEGPSFSRSFSSKEANEMHKETLNARHRKLSIFIKEKNRFTSSQSLKFPVHGSSLRIPSTSPLPSSSSFKINGGAGVKKKMVSPPKYEKLCQIIAFALFRDDISLLERLPRHFLSIVINPKKMLTPLHIAAYHNSVRCLRYLANNFSLRELNQLSGAGMSAFQMACIRNHFGSALILARQGAHISSRTKLGYLLHLVPDSLSKEYGYFTCHNKSLTQDSTSSNMDIVSECEQNEHKEKNSSETKEDITHEKILCCNESSPPQFAQDLEKASLLNKKPFQSIDWESLMDLIREFPQVL